MENQNAILGFGCMRLPMKNGQVDTQTFSDMIDTYLNSGFHYFDTAHGYTDTASETALRAGLTSRYPRERYILTDKLTNVYFNSEAEIRPFFENQLAACGVEYFDYYLMHAQNADIFQFFKKHHAYETALALKSEGKIRHFGISFHDKAAVLDQILSEYPQIEIVQIQLNYLDYDDPAIESGKCLEVCRKHGKPVIVMEPVKGGHLAQLPAGSQSILENLHAGSPASFAIRFAAGCEGVKIVLSGMSDLVQMKDNLQIMQNYRPLNEQEKAAIEQVRTLLRADNLISCTACRYCTAGCPAHISIPDLFACMNSKTAFHDWNAEYYYHEVHTKNHGKASDCLQCGKCEKICPQHLPIRELLKKVAAEFEHA